MWLEDTSDGGGENTAGRPSRQLTKNLGKSKKKTTSCRPSKSGTDQKIVGTPPSNSTVSSLAKRIERKREAAKRNQHNEEEKGREEKKNRSS